MFDRSVVVRAAAALFVGFAPAAAAEPADRKDCEQQERAYVSLLACSRLLMAPDTAAADKIRMYERRARAALTLFYFAEAAEDFTLVLAAEPENIPALAGRGEALSENGEFSKAAEDWARVAALRADDVAARLHLGKNLHAAGSFSKAIAAYEEALKLDPKNAAGLVGLARAYDMADQRDKSDEAIGIALNLNPANTAALMARGEIAERRGNTELAIESYKLSLKFNGMQVKPRHALQRLGIETPP